MHIKCVSFAVFANYLRLSSVTLQKDFGALGTIYPVNEVNLVQGVLRECAQIIKEQLEYWE